MAEKITLRAQMLQQRQAATLQEIASASELICSNFFKEFDLSNIKTLHVFLPIPEKNELDTWLIIKRLRTEFPQIRLVVPVTPPGAKELIHRLLTPETELIKSKWGIPEPSDASTQVPEIEIDFVLVPLLAFDLKGHRVGYGKGYYDKFLNKCRPDVIKTGLSLFPPVAVISDSDLRDIPLDHCVTPDKVFNF